MKNIFENHKLILLSFFAAGLALIFWILFSTLSFPVSRHTFRSDKKAVLNSGFPVYQKFTAERDGLSQINFSLGNLELKLGEKIQLTLKDENCEQVLREDKITAFAFEPRIYEKFNFPRIEDSKNKTYCFAAVFETKDSNRKDEPYIEASNQPQFEGYSYFRTENNREYKNRSLIMKPAYENKTLAEDMGELTDRMSQYKPWFFKDRYILIIAILTILLSSMLAVALIFL